MFLEELEEPSVTPWQGAEDFLKRSDEGILRLAKDADSKRGRVRVS